MQKGCKQTLRTQSLFHTLCKENPQKGYKTHDFKHKEDFESVGSKQGIHSLLHQAIIQRRLFNWKMSNVIYPHK